MKQTFPLLLFFLWSFSAKGQYCGLDETITLVQSDSFVLNLEIEGLFNDNLASPDQGVCGVEIFFVHNSISALDLFLESPAGTRVQLIGPAGAPNASLLTVWDISFVPLSQVAEPDSAFLPKWDNNQPNEPGSGYTYIGSYYPYQGNLEDFNSGPVNGTWKLIFKDPDGGFVPGKLFDFRIIMCDETGQDCCFARSGQLTGPNLRYCAGDPSLDIAAPDPYFRTKGPDTTEYDYTYAIANYNLLLGFEDDPDLSSYPPGLYTICGLSYGKGEESKFPPGDGLWDMNSLRNNLAGLMPLFCGELTDDCITIEITAESPLTELYPIICEGESYQVGDSFFTETGNYLVNLTNSVGCDSLIAIDLSVFPHVQDTVETAICRGDAIRIGNTSYTETGYYVDTLQTYVGCDSVVHLYLEVIEPVFDTLNTVLCAGETVEVGGQVFDKEGSYQLRLTSAANCDSFLTLNLRLLSPLASISGAGELNCYDPELELNGNNSGGNGSLTFEWLGSSGEVLGTDIRFLVSAAGTYGLRVTQQESGQVCSNTDYVDIPENFSPPIAELGPDLTLNCYNPELLAGTPTTSLGAEFIYGWRGPPGANLVPVDTAKQYLPLNQPGTYVLTVQNITNGCLAEDSLRVTLDTLSPFAEAGDNQILTCAIVETELDGRASTQGSDYLYQWSGPLISGDTTLTPGVDKPGIYELTVTDTRNGCFSTDQTEVLLDTLVPDYDYDPALWLNCRERSVILDASFVLQSSDFVWGWLGGTPFAAGESTLSPRADQPGTYRLELTFDSNSCRDTLDFVVRDTINTIVAGISPVGPLSCAAPTQILDAGASTSGQDINYLWSSPDGLLPGSLEQPTLQVDQPGTYILTVLDSFTYCEAEAMVEVIQDTLAPVFLIAPPEVLTCEILLTDLEPLVLSADPEAEYFWTGPCIEGDPSGKTIAVSCPGSYSLTIRNPGNGCETTQSVVVRADTLAPEAEAGLPGLLTCTMPTFTLDATGSSEGNNMSYSWITHSGVMFSDHLNPEVSEAGWYFLEVTNEDNGCTTVDSVLVSIDTLSPVADAGMPDTLNCVKEIVALGGMNSSIGSEITYGWFTDEGQFAGPDFTAVTLTEVPGTYGLIVNNAVNGCSDTSYVLVIDDFNIPVADAGDEQVLSCDDQILTLDAGFSEQGESIQYFWDGPCIYGNPQQEQVEVNCAGSYWLTVLNVRNGCLATDSVVVSRHPDIPAAILPDSLALSCLTGRVRIDATQSVGTSFSWLKDGNPINFQSLDPVVEKEGSYTLLMSNAELSCSDTAVVVLTESCTPIISLASEPDTLNCISETVLLEPEILPTEANYEYLWLAENDSCLESPSDSKTMEVSCGGLYRLVVTNTALGYSDTLEILVSEDKQAPLAGILLPDTLTCVRTSVVLDGSGSDIGTPFHYLWTDFNGDTLGNTIEMPVTAPGNYALEVYNHQNGCKTMETVMVEENRISPQIAFDTDMRPCYQDTFDLSVSVLPTGESYDYRWAGPGILSANTVPVIRVAETGLFSVVVTNNSTGCFSQDSVQVNELDCPPCLSAAMADTLTCARTEVQLKAGLCYPCSDCTFSWSSVDGQIVAGAQGLEPLVAAAGTYTLTATKANGTFSTLDIWVAEDLKAPLVEAGPERLLSCKFPETALGSLQNPSDSRYTYRWLDQSGMVLSSERDISGIKEGGWYYLEGSDLHNGCEATDSVRVQVDTLRPVVVIANPDTLTCARSLVNLDGSASDAGPNITYQWLKGADTLFSGGPILPAAMPGIYSLVLTNEANGCLARESVTLLEDIEKPVFAQLNPDTLTCAVTSVILEAKLSNGTASAFEWCRVSAEGIAQNCTVGSTRETTEAGTYQVGAVLAGNGCSNTLEIIVPEDRLAPELLFDEPLPLTCERTLTAIDASASDLGPEYVFSWIGPGEEFAGTEKILSNIDLPGNYRLILGNNRNGCRDSVNIVVEIDTLHPSVAIDNSDYLDCVQREVWLEAEASPENRFSYHWTSSDGLILGTADSAYVRGGAAGIYRVSVKNLENGCSGEAETIVEEQSTPIDSAVVSFQVPDCRNERNGSISIGEISGGAAPFVYALNNRIFAAAPEFRNLSPGDYVVYVQGANGCEWGTQVNLPGSDRVQVELGPDREIFWGDSVSIVPEITGSTTASIRWLSGDQTFSSSNERIVVAPVNSETYFIRVETEEGCSAEDFITVYVRDRSFVSVPDAFSPNGDGKNDRFELFLLPQIREVKQYQIFDRWGNVVFQHNDWQPGAVEAAWDGTVNGQLLNSQVLVYRLEFVLYDGTLRSTSGSFTLLR